MAFLLLVGLVLFVQILYSNVSLHELNVVEDIGFTIIANNSLPNGIVTGVAEKYRNASIFNASKYTTMINDLSTLTKSSTPLQIAAMNN